eukprot:3271425-Pleurochrysis_carterae.AAC.1
MVAETSAQQSCGEAAAPRPTPNDLEAVQVSSKVHLGRGEGDREGKEVVFSALGRIPCLVGGIEDQRGDGQSVGDLRSASP